MGRYFQILLNKEILWQIDLAVLSLWHLHVYYLVFPLAPNDASKWSGRSFMKTMKSKGPRILPWGTPCVTGLVSEIFPLNWRNCSLFCKYDFSQSIVFLSHWYRDSFLRRMSVSTRSNAFLSLILVNLFPCWKSTYPQVCLKMFHKNE